METINTVGRRKTSVARIFLGKGKGEIQVNNKKYDQYFTTEVLRAKVREVFTLTDSLKKYKVRVNVKGGGYTGQAEAIRHGLARALVKIDEDSRKLFKPYKLLTRDSRMVERKKSGQPKARKKFQFSKR